MNIAKYELAANRYARSGIVWIVLGVVSIIAIPLMIVTWNWPKIANAEILSRELDSASPFFGMAVLCLVVGFVLRAAAKTLRQLIADVEHQGRDGPQAS